MPAGLRATARPLLAADWRLCAAEPGSPRPGEGAAWRPIEGPVTVAAALRTRGEWSLDAPAQDFDAQDWWYVAHFDAPADPALRTLRFEGLATHCEAWLNGQPLFTSDNMFVANDARVASLLRPRGNELALRFASLRQALAQRRQRPRWRTPMVADQQLRWWRTTLLGRTPGWSPPAAPVGPWRDIVWIADDAAPGYRLHADVDDGDGRVRLTLLNAADRVRGLESAELVLRGPRVEHRQAVDGFQATLRVPDPQLWWPHTHGEPTLYEASLRWQRKDGARGEAALGCVGFRTLDIDRANDGFTLRVNGVPVFCRGAGWTPLDPVSLRSTPQACADAVKQARDAGMNMLRLAGTLAYEEDAFYAACDELGVMLWQDFMFASMDYPFGDEAFARAAAEEARQQLDRLHAHPCIAVLCGNSEVEQQAAMWGAPRELWRPAFFHETLAALCRDQAPGIPYWPSSAHGGAFPHQANAGTTSYYGVGAYERAPEDARRSSLKFATECLAFANIPEPSALARLPGGLATRVHHPQWKSRSPRDLGAGWDFDDVRDHYVQRLFGIDPARLRHADHDRYLALGRLATAEAMRAAFSEWRRPGSGCGGALLLFLRDLWAGAGWGVIDDAGEAKSPLHAIAGLLQPLAVFLTDEGGNGVDVHVVNDRGRPWRGELELSAWREGDVRVAQGRRAVEVPAHGGLTLSAVEVFGQFLDLNQAYRFGPPACDALVATLRDAEGRACAESLHFPVGLADLLARRTDPGLQAELHLDGPQATATLRTQRLALDVHVDVPGWRALDNHFHLAPGASRTVRLHRVREGAALAGQVTALNAAAALPLETAA